MGACLCKIHEYAKIYEQDDPTALRVGVFFGKFMCSEHVFKIWKAPSRKFILFISSTFTDTKEERDILLKKILLELRIMGREQDIEVRFVDMRYGVKDESTLKQMTWDECVKEEERCMNESGGISFLSLQSDKYGYMPLPRKIPKKIFESYRDKFDKDTREIADKWYRFDSNTNCYVLENLVDLNDKEYWDKVLPTLVKALDNCEFNPVQYPCLLYTSPSPRDLSTSRMPSSA